MINTIFYFAPSLEEYNANREAGLIDDRTICFVPTSETSGTIYKGGVKFGSADKSMLENII